MMQIIKGKTNFNFIGKRRVAIYFSTVVNLALLIGIVIVGFNWGVDFIGGTLVEVKFEAAVTAEQVREAAKEGGLQEPQIQGIGPAEDNAFILRMGGVTQLTEENQQVAQEALQQAAEVVSLTKNLDNGLINVRYKSEVDTQLLKTAIEKVGTGVKEVRFLGEVDGMFDYQIVFAGMADKVKKSLQSGLSGTKFEIRRVDYVGPQVGKQLRNKGIMALLYAMVVILLYLAFRFEPKFAPGALVAMFHDVVMVSGYFLITQREFNLTSIAVLLTILGYSINDTIVIYDRIREEMVKYKGKPLSEIINIAVNDTLSRTVLTGVVTSLSLVGLLIFGVGEIFDFAAAMLIGIIVGMYSSVYIASPMVIWLDERQMAKAQRM